MAEPHDGRRLREFIILVQHFTQRLRRDFFGTGEGDASSSIATTLALLMAYGVCVAVFLILAFSFQLIRTAIDSRIEAVLSARDVLTASTIAITGAYFVFLWDNLFPDRSDCHILLAQPVSPMLVLGAKLAASLGFLAMFAAAMHVFSFFVLPFVTLTAGAPSLLREFPAFVIPLAAAMLTVFFALAAVLAFLLLVLPTRLFQWLKPFLQLATFVAFLGQMFFSPPIAELRVPGEAALSRFASFWPSFWFVGLADWLSDGFLPHGAELAFTAILVTAGSVLAGGVAIRLAYPKAVRQAMEETDFAQRRRPRFLLSEFVLHPWLGDDPPAFALGLYTLKVLLRDARSRAMFLLFAGLAIAYAMREVAQLLAAPGGADTRAPQVYLLPIPLVLIFFALLAIRSLCATPISLQASWIFWLVDWGDVRRVRKGVRGVMAAAVVFPTLAGSLAFHAWLWGSWLSCTHTVFLAMMALILMEWILHKVDTVPFTRPKAEHLGRLRVMFGIWVLLFVTFTFFVAHLEYALLQSPAAFLVFLLAMAPVWYWLHRRNERVPSGAPRTFGKMESLLVGLDLEG